LVSLPSVAAFLESRQRRFVLARLVGVEALIEGRLWRVVLHRAGRHGTRGHQGNEGRRKKRLGCPRRKQLQFLRLHS
jgi:hypothetical protein